MSLSNTFFNNRRGKNGEISPLTPTGGVVNVTPIGTASTTVLDTPTKGSAASQVQLSTSAAVAAVINLSSDGVARGTIKKILTTTVAGSTITITSIPSAQIINGSAIVNTVQTVAGSTGFSTVFQYTGNNTWRIIENSGPTIA